MCARVVFVQSTAKAAELLSWWCSVAALLQYCLPFVCVTDCERYAVLFREFVSRKAFGRGKAILEFVGLTREVIDMCYMSNPLDDEEAIQDGLKKWRESRGDRCTWQVLLDAMKFAGVKQQHCSELVEELHQRMQGEVTFLLKYSVTQHPHCSWCGTGETLVIGALNVYTAHFWWYA